MAAPSLPPPPIVQTGYFTSIRAPSLRRATTRRASETIAHRVAAAWSARPDRRMRGAPRHAHRRQSCLATQIDLRAAADARRARASDPLRPCRSANDQTEAKRLMRCSADRVRAVRFPGAACRRARRAGASVRRAWQLALAGLGDGVELGVAIVLGLLPAPLIQPRCSRRMSASTAALIQRQRVVRHLCEPFGQRIRMQRPHRRQRAEDDQIERSLSNSTSPSLLDIKVKC